MKSTALGLIFANIRDDVLNEITSDRSMASVPYGAKYRIVDFHISSFVNAGITNVAIAANSNYRSLMEHIDSGKSWDLDRKTGGIHILPPFVSGSNAGAYNDHIDAIHNLLYYLEESDEECVIIADADTIYNVDFDEMLDFHTKSGADVTVLYKNGPLPEIDHNLTFDVSDDGKLYDLVLCDNSSGNEKAYSFGTLIFGREKLIELVKKAYSEGQTSISRGILQKNEDLEIYGYELKGYGVLIDSMYTFVQANMDLLNNDVRKSLFNSDKPIYTKAHDDCYTKYGLDCNVKNSIIGEGCEIYGNVENCIIFRNVIVGEDSVLKDCIIMQDTIIGNACNLQYVLTDRDAEISEGASLNGAKNNYYVLKRGEKI